MLKPSVKSKPTKPKPKKLNTKTSPSAVKNAIVSKPKQKKLKQSSPSVLKKPVLSKPKPEKLKKKTSSIVKNPVVSQEISDIAAKYRVEPSTVQKALTGLMKFTSENPKLKNKLFEDEKFPIFVQINTFKVPRKNFSKILRISLKHSMLEADSEICLIAADVKGIPNKEHEKHVDYYEKLLTQKGVDNVKKVMTFHEFRTEYETFEMKKRLMELYDVFLVDGRISGKCVKKCGKAFYKKRKVPTSLKMGVSKLKEHFDRVLMKTALYLHSKGDSFVAQIGHSNMTNLELTENAICVVEALEKGLPGGFDNVRSLNLYTFRGIAMPIYTSLKNKNSIDLDKNVPKEKPAEVVTGELTTLLHSKVAVSSTGEVEVFKSFDKNNRKRKLSNSKQNGLEVKDKKKKVDLNKTPSQPKKKTNAANVSTTHIKAEGTKKNKKTSKEAEDATLQNKAKNLRRKSVA